MGEPLSVTLSDIYMTRTETNVVKSEKLLFYRTFIDDVINTRKKNEHDIIFKNLNMYYPKINLTIEVNPCKFLDTNVSLTIKVTSQQKFSVKRPNYKCIDHPRFQSGTGETLY